VIESKSGQRFLSRLVQRKFSFIAPHSSEIADQDNIAVPHAAPPSAAPQGELLAVA
jgi:hypothetical protein